MDLIMINHQKRLKSYPPSIRLMPSHILQKKISNQKSNKTHPIHKISSSFFDHIFHSSSIITSQPQSFSYTFCGFSHTSHHSSFSLVIQYPYPFSTNRAIIIIILVVVFELHHTAGYQKFMNFSKYTLTFIRFVCQGFWYVFYLDFDQVNEIIKILMLEMYDKETRQEIHIQTIRFRMDELFDWIEKCQYLCL